MVCYQRDAEKVNVLDVCSPAVEETSEIERFFS